MWSDYMQDFWRHCRRAPLPTVVNLVALTLGLTCFIGAWLVSSYWSLSDQHFENADRIELISLGYGDGAAGTGPKIGSATPVIKYLQTDFPQLEAVARIYRPFPVPVSNGENQANLMVGYADAALTDIFDFEFIYGDPKTALAEPDSVVLLENTARRLFGEENPIGRTVRMSQGIRSPNDRDLPVTGVIATIPQPSHFGDHPNAYWRFDFLVSRQPLNPESQEFWTSTDEITYVLHPEGYSAAAFKQALSDYDQRRVPEDQRAIASHNFSTLALGEIQQRALDLRLFQGRTGLLSIIHVLFGFALLVLVVSCVNYANVATAQATTRAREIGMFKVMGASAWAIFIQQWVEALLLICVAVLLSLMLLLAFAPSLEAATSIDVQHIVFSEPRLLLVLLGLALIVSLAASAYPSLYLASITPAQALQAGQKRSGPKWLGEILVGTQFFFASSLLILVVVMTAQNEVSRQRGLSPDKDPVAVLTDLHSRRAGASYLRDVLANEPSVHSISQMFYRPWTGFDSVAIYRASRDTTADELRANNHEIGYNFFEVFGTKVLAGRTYEVNRDRDWITREDEEFPAEFRVVVDWNMAKGLGFASPEDAIGKEIYWSSATVEQTGRDPVVRIIGVVETVPTQHGTGSRIANVYPLVARNNLRPLVRFDRNRIAEGMAAVEAAVKSQFPEAAVEFSFTDSLFNQSFRLYQGIFTAFTSLALMAFLIAAMGLFAMSLFIANRRRHEIGIRKTLGWTATDVVALLLKDFSRPVLLANVIAWPIAYFAAQTYLQGFMQRIELTPWPWIVGLLTTLAIAWLVVGSQTLRAARANPADVLRVS